MSCATPALLLTADEFRAELLSHLGTPTLSLGGKRFDADDDDTERMLEFAEHHIQEGIKRRTRLLKAAARTPRILAAERRLAVMHRAAKVLAAGLREDPNASWFVAPGLYLEGTGLDHGERYRIELPPMREWNARPLRSSEDLERAAQTKVDEQIAVLEGIAEEVGKLLEGKNKRDHYGLSLLSAAGRSATSAALWPELFYVWKCFGNKLGIPGNDGPLKRFVEFIHSSYGLDEEVRSSTLRDAVMEYRERLGPTPGKWRPLYED